jgi:hypothetical protein
MESTSTRSQIQRLQAEMTVRDFAHAADRAQAMLADRADDLLVVEDNERVSIAGYVDGLASADVAGLAPEFRKRWDEQAHAQLAAALADPHGSPADCYGVARKYPWSTDAARAMAFAGDRASSIGDWPSARTFYGLAKSAGWDFDDAQLKRIEYLKREGDSQTPPSAAQPDDLPYVGALPYQATWYGRTDSSAITRFFPYQAGHQTFLEERGKLSAFALGQGLTWWISCQCLP